MPQGYTRQSSAAMIDGADISADIFNAEFNQIQSSMNAVTGHNHDGTAGGGSKIDLANSVTGILPVAKGGTGAITATTNGVIYGNGTAAFGVTAAGTQYQVLVVGASGVPNLGAVNLASGVAVAGALPITNGGTGSNNATSARASLGISDIAAAKSNLAALTAPTSVNDLGQGYGVGSIWVNTASGTGYMCVSASAGAAVWKQITN